MTIQPFALQQRARQRRRAVFGHACPKCRKPWALTAVAGDTGFLVMCRYCAYDRPVDLPRQRVTTSPLGSG